MNESNDKQVAEILARGVARMQVMRIAGESDLPNEETARSDNDVASEHVEQSDIGVEATR